MFAIGHLALGYLTGKTTSKLLNVKVDIPLLLLLSILPDFDLLIQGLEHRGPTHSLFVYALFLFPALAMYGKKTLPYFVALMQHSLLGDLLTGGGVQIMWPLTLNWYGAQIKITSLINISIEWVIFVSSFTLMLKTKDVWTLFRHHPSNMLSTVPVITIILPAFLAFPIGVPLVLLPPHFIYLPLLVISVLVDVKSILKTLKTR